MISEENSWLCVKIFLSFDFKLDAEHGSSYEVEAPSSPKVDVEPLSYDQKNDTETCSPYGDYSDGSDVEADTPVIANDGRLGCCIANCQ